MLEEEAEVGLLAGGGAVAETQSAEEECGWGPIKDPAGPRGSSTQNFLRSPRREDDMNCLRDTGRGLTPAWETLLLTGV